MFDVVCSQDKILGNVNWEWHSPLINSLAPRKFEWYFRYVIFKRILVIDGWDIDLL